jgi:GTPase
MPKVWYVAIVGRPNAGKSTLLNALIGEKVSAISHRPQTTQRSIPGILTDEEQGVQIIFLDTPGIHNHSGEQYGSQKVYDINERINSEAYASLHSADVVLRLLDPTRTYGEEDERIDALLTKIDTPIIRIETKQDLENKSYPQKWVDLRIDSVARTGFDTLLAKIATLLPEGPYLYEVDYYTDQPMDLRIAEIIRERLFLELGDEIPYASYVDIEQIENDDPDLMKIHANIYVESDSQKVIMIGKWGAKIQKIGTEARVVLEEIFGKRIFLALRVKVHKNWRKDQKVLDKIFPKK